MQPVQLVPSFLARRLFLLALLIVGQHGWAQNFSYQNFTSLTGLVPNGNAAQGAPIGPETATVLRLTNNTWQASSAWYGSVVPVANGFTTTFGFNINSCNGFGCADGFAFVVQNAQAGTTAIGASAENIGYGGIANSLAIEFDTYQNSYDPNNNHVAVQSCGTQSNTSNHTQCNLSINSSLPIKLTDAASHTVTIAYVPGTLTTSIDGTVVMTTTVNLSSLLTLNAGQAYVGFTGGSGNGAENADILNWSFAGVVSQGNGLDVSAAIGNQSAQDAFWGQATGMGIQFAAVAAWGGGPAPYSQAEANLLGAQQHGVGTAAYALLNYFQDETGAYQIDQAIQAIGTAKNALKFMVVDVEYCCGEFVNWKPSHRYKPSGNPDVSSITDPNYHVQEVVKAGISGASAPAWNDSGGQTLDGTVTWQDTGHVVIPDSPDRVKRISDAVAEIQANNLTPVIYTTRGFWRGFAGNCDANLTKGTNCASLIQLKLWDAENKCGDGIVGLTPFTPYPNLKYGWKARSGNQYKISSTGCKTTLINNVPVDLDYFDPNLFR